MVLNRTRKKNTVNHLLSGSHGPYSHTYLQLHAMYTVRSHMYIHLCSLRDTNMVHVIITFCGFEILHFTLLETCCEHPTHASAKVSMTLMLEVLVDEFSCVLPNSEYFSGGGGGKIFVDMEHFAGSWKKCRSYVYECTNERGSLHLWPYGNCFWVNIS